MLTKEGIAGTFRRSRMRAAASRLVLSRTVKGSGVMTSATLCARARTPHACATVDARRDAVDSTHHPQDSS